MPNKEISATAFIVVSQSETLARGVCEAVISMAPNVVMASCGCHDEGLETATSLVKQSVLAMMDHLNADCSIVVMADFGAARMAAQKALTDLGNRNIVMGNGPFLEGLAAGVVAAQQGESLNAVLRSIAAAAQFFPGPSVSAVGAEPVPRKQKNPLAPRVLEVTDPKGMGPKEAAVFARRASEFDAQITLNGQDATSVLSLMGLHLSQGDQVTLAATGSQASIALEQLPELISSPASLSGKEGGSLVGFAGKSEGGAQRRAKGESEGGSGSVSGNDGFVGGSKVSEALTGGSQGEQTTRPVASRPVPGELTRAVAPASTQPVPADPAQAQPVGGQAKSASSKPGSAQVQSVKSQTEQAPAQPDQDEPLSGTAQLIRRLGISQLPK